MELFIVVLTIVARVWAESTSATTTAAVTADLFAVNYPIVAYLVGSEANVATTYLIGCPSGTDTTSCEFAQPYTLIEGPKTVSFEFTSPIPNSPTQSFTLGCDLQGTTSLGCSATGLADDSPSTMTTSEVFTYTGTEAARFFRPVTLVAASTSLLTYTPGATITSSSASQTGTATVTKTNNVFAEMATGSSSSSSSRTSAPSASASTTKSSAVRSVGYSRGMLCVATIAIVVIGML